MTEGKARTTDNALLSLLKSSIAADGSTSFGELVLYTSFGVVRGRVGYAFAQRLSGHNGSDKDESSMDEVVELNSASVEHYSNHLPTASFDRLYVRLSEVQGFALMGAQGQS